MYSVFLKAIPSLLLIGCANSNISPEVEYSDLHLTSLSKIDEQRETLSLKSIKTTGYLVYRDDNDRYTKGFFLLYEKKLDDGLSCVWDLDIPPVLIFKSEFPKEYRQFDGVKVTISGTFENKKSDFLVLSGSKGNLFSGRNGPLKNVKVISVEANEKCRGY